VLIFLVPLPLFVEFPCLSLPSFRLILEMLFAYSGPGLRKV
jgi:hypothetical protein